MTGNAGNPMGGQERVAKVVRGHVPICAARLPDKVAAKTAYVSVTNRI